MSLEKDKAIRIENNKRNVKIYIFICSKCPKEIRARYDYLNNHSGMCRSCSNQGLPYITQYKNLFHDHRKTQVLLTYEEYLEFTYINNCHYCDDIIPWKKHKNRSKAQQAYYLDRKNNNGPYSKDNCVVCCTRCNRMRSNKFTYEEFLLFSPILKQIMKDRIK